MMDVFYVDGIKYDPRDAKLVKRFMIELLPDHDPICGFMQCFLDQEEERWLKAQDSSCTNCGGSGAVTVTEIYTDSKGKTQTRTVRRVCGTCNGRGGYHV